MKVRSALVSVPLMLDPDKYARIERERRFLLANLPINQPPTATHKIIDRYLAGTRLRLRHLITDGSSTYKLTQKIPAARPGPVQGFITNTYLSPAQYHLLANLPGKILTKTRYSIPPLGIDVFAPPLQGLIMGEAEFDNDADMLAFQTPPYVIAEVTDDPRFTSGRLVNASRTPVAAWLGQYGLDTDPTPSRSPR